MCHDDDSRPPAPPRIGPVAEHHDLVLTSADGSRSRAYLAVPGEPVGAAVVILPDVRGLHPFYEALAVRFAEAGVHALAVDWFGRPLGPAVRTEVPDWQQLIAQVRPIEVEQDVAAAMDQLRERGATGPVFTVGFCFGGSRSWYLGASALDLAGCIGFYGRPPLVAEVAADLRHPLLLLIAGADRGTPLPDSLAFGERLTALGKEHELHVYPGAPHSFFDRAFDEWRPACDDAWRRILDFVAAHGAPRAAA